MTENLPIIFALMVGIFPLLVFALIVAPSVRTEDQFFLASAELSQRGLFATLGASWIFLGNVIIANMILGSYYGWANWWAIGTWAFGFWLAGRHAFHIREKYGSVTTLHGYLSQAYNTPLLKYVAAFVTAVVAVGVISLELIVGMALVVPLAPDLQWLPFAFGGILAITIAWYTSQGGLTAVVKTDIYQLSGIIVGILSLLIISIILINSPVATKPLSPTLWIPSSEMLVAPGWAFYMGVFFLQVPLLLGDFGTWQRIRATGLNARNHYASAFTKVAILNTVLWSIMVFAGMSLTTLGQDYGDTLQDSALYATAQPVLQVMQIVSDPKLGIDSMLSAALLFCFTLGLVWAMMSSADSYLIIALQTLVKDFFGIKESQKKSTSYHGLEAKNVDLEPVRLDNSALAITDIDSAVVFARRISVFLVAIALSVAVLTVVNGVNLLSLVFIIFGAQAVLAPLAVFALREDVDTSNNFKSVASISAAVAFLVAVGYGIWATFFSNDEWHILNGPYLVPAIATLLPTFAIGVSGYFYGGWSNVWGYIKAWSGNY